MQFIVYIAVLLVSISSILLELDWLTKPKLETKPAMHAASVPPPRVVAKADGPNAGPSPVVAPKKAAAPPANETSTNVPNVPQAAASPAAAPQPANAPPPVAPAVNAAAAAVETTGKAEPAQPATQETRANAAAEITAPPPPQQDAKQANAGNPVPAAVELARVTAAPPPANTGTSEPAAPEQPRAMASNPPQAAPPQPPAPAPVAETASVTTKRQCDVSACAAAYHSFRESDCTYQPFEGARRVCVAPPSGQPRSADRGPRRETDPRLARTAREIDRDIDWRASSRQRGPVVGDADDDYNAPRPPGRIIMIERGYGRWP